MRDREIIDMYWARNEAAIHETAEKYGGYCSTIAYNILQCREDAEECANDTYLSAWNAMPPGRPAVLSAFLGRIARNISINRYKRMKAEKRGCGQTELVLSELEDCVPSGRSVEREVEDRLLVSAIESYLRAQPAERRGVFIRRYWHFYPIRDIALAYGMSESKTTSLLFRMRNELREHLEKEGITI